MKCKLIYQLILLFVAGTCLGQAKLQIDSTEMLIGDQRVLTLTVPLSEAQNWANPDVTLPDSLTSIQIISTALPKESKVGNARLVEQKWVISAFDTGFLYIPKLPVVISQQNRFDTFYTNDIPIFVRGVVADSAGLSPIKDIIGEPMHWLDFLWLYIAIAAMVAVYFAFRVMKRKGEGEIEEIVIERPPHEIAFEELDELEGKKLWQQGEIKTYHSELTHILREYLERKFHIAALESTSDEIMTEMRQVGFESDLQNKTRELLQLSDMVKFAKAQPKIEIHAELMNHVRNFVIKTKDTITHFNDEEE